MNGNAYIAVPSTTSMTIQPTILGYFYLFVNMSVILQQIEPPNECPTIITFLSLYLSITCFKTSIVYKHNV